MNLLVLCTGNICRSPMAQAMLVRAAERRAAEVEVGSAGFATEDRPAEPDAVHVMAERGLDVSGHRSRLVTDELIEGADLVLGMTRDHVRRACTSVGEAFPRTFTLKELVRRGGAVGPVPDGLAPWLEAIGTEREPSLLLGEATEDDIADPMGRSRRRFRSCADELDAQVDALADLLWPQTAP